MGVGVQVGPIFLGDCRNLGTSIRWKDCSRLPTEKLSLILQARCLPLLNASGLWVCLIT